MCSCYFTRVSNFEEAAVLPQQCEYTAVCVCECLLHRGVGVDRAQVAPKNTRNSATTPCNGRLRILTEHKVQAFHEFQSWEFACLTAPE